MNHKLFPSLQNLFKRFEQEFQNIPSPRAETLRQLTQFVEDKLSVRQPAFLNFICTHNSRRSHIAQIWAQAAAAFYGVNDVHCFSGGTEATAFNPRAIQALQHVGFRIEKTREGSNPRYEVFFSEAHLPVVAFSKKYDDAGNPSGGFAAVMTCSQADENCPVVIGAEKRISLPYDDPKDFDGTPKEEEKYRERVLEIGREISYALGNVKPIR
jgi:arsenate reductase